MDAQKVAAYVKSHEIVEVPICDMQSVGSLLEGVDGRTFREIATNIWANVEGGDGVVYLGTGRHGGGIVLRPLFVMLDGVWVNASTGKEAQPELAGSFRANALPPTRVLADVSESERCEGLVEICEAVAWAPQLKVVYQRLCDAAAKALKCNETHLHLISPDGMQFVKCAYHAESPALYDWEERRPATIGRMQWMIENARPIVMDYEHPHFEDKIPEEALAGGIMGAVSIPIQADGVVLGMLSAVYRMRTEWSKEDCDFLVSLGRLMGALIKRLYDTKKAGELQILNERKMLSTEIHENVSSLLGALSVNAAAALAALDEGDVALAQDDLKRLEIAAGETMRILRDEMLSLRISCEQTDGFVEGIQESLSNFEKNWGIRTELTVSGIEGPIIVPLHVSIQLTRILNECLSNTLKHANASSISVRVRSDLCKLLMTVEDDGCGFDVDAVESDRFGLKIMRERAAAAGGSVSVLSNGEGTVVCVEVPKKMRYQEGLRDA